MIETFLKLHHDSVIFVLPMIVTIVGLIFSLIVIGYIKNRVKKPLSIICGELYRFMKYGVYLTLLLLGLEIVFKLLMPTYFVRLHQFAGIFILTALLLGYINAVINQLYVWQQAKLRKDNKRGQITQLNGIKHVSKVILSLVVLISVLDYLELPITGLLAGLGAGTFAAAIAMQDVIRNLFGGLVVFISQPFKVGDYISSVQAKIEGRVEEIGWRATEIIDDDGAPVLIPNGNFISMIITNLSNRKSRKFNELFGVRYEDFTQIEKVISDIKALAKQQDLIDQEQRFYAYFTNVEPTSCEIMVRCLFKTSDEESFLHNRARLIEQVLEIIKRHQAAMIWVKSSLKK